MILVDERVGSKEFKQPLREAGVEADTTHLDFGDFCFVGRGEKNIRLDIGVERKEIHDLVSSVRSGRLAGHQLPGLLKAYDHTWLVVEGQWSANKQGIVCTYAGKQRGWVAVPGRMHATELDKHLLTLEMRGGLRVRFTNGKRDTVRFLVSLYRWWTDRALDEHRSHIVTHDAPTLVPLSDFRAAVCKWPGVGVEWSAAVEKVFTSISEAASSPVPRWATLTRTNRKNGRIVQFGTKNAQKVVAFLRGETNGQ